MAEIPVMINGMIYDKQWRTARPVVLYGMASYADREIGGGPIYPEQPPGGEHPAFPIWGPPGSGFPGTPGYPPTAEHPIVIPDPPPTEPPTGEPGDDGFVKPPPEGGGWGYSAEYGWMYKPKEGQAGPKR